MLVIRGVGEQRVRTCSRGSVAAIQSDDGSITVREAIVGSSRGHVPRCPPFCDNRAIYP